VTSQQDKAALVLFKDAHWMAQEGVALSKFESLSSFLTEVCICSVTTRTVGHDKNETRLQKYKLFTIIQNKDNYICENWIMMITILINAVVAGSRKCPMPNNY